MHPANHVQNYRIDKKMHFNKLARCARFKGRVKGTWQSFTFACLNFTIFDLPA